MQFETGTSYLAGHGDYQSTFKVIKRTPKFIIIQEISEYSGPEGAIKRIGIRGDQVEFAYPFGSYSQCPVLHADRKAA